MKSKPLPISLLILLLIATSSYSQKKVEWKGSIEYENGVKVVKNPEIPLYGEVTFNLEEDLSIGNEEDENYLFFKFYGMAVNKQGYIYVADGGNTRLQVYDNEGLYIRTIGRKGQGPGEFQNPRSVFLAEQNGEIYVLDSMSIKVFSSNGNFQRTIPLKSFYRSYCMNPAGIMIGETNKYKFKGNDKSQVSEIFASLILISSTDGSETIIASFPDQLSKLIEGRTSKFTHGYEHEFQMSAIDLNTFVYGFSSSYELVVIDRKGKLLYEIKKEVLPIPISIKEKNAVREKYRDSPIKNVNDIPFPKHKPYFGNILADSGFIFVMHYKSPQNQSEACFMDVFNLDGHYLYKCFLPVQPRIIKNGFVYLIDSSDETENIQIKRYKIKNWDQIKEETE